jgi:hypothetical protein
LAQTTESGRFSNCLTRIGLILGGFWPPPGPLEIVMHCEGILKIHWLLIGHGKTAALLILVNGELEVVFSVAKVLGLLFRLA